MWHTWYCQLVIASRGISWEHQSRFTGFRNLPLQQGYFSWRRIYGDLGYRKIYPSCAAAASNSNSKPQETSIDSPGPSTCTSKEETRPSSPENIRPLPQAGPRKSQNVNKKKRTTVILTDRPAPVKNSLKKLQRTSWSNWEKLGQLREERNACAAFLARGIQKKHRKTSRNGRMQAAQKKKAPRIIYACTV